MYEIRHPPSKIFIPSLFMDGDGFATRNFNIESLSNFLQALVEFLIWLRNLTSLNKAHSLNKYIWNTS